ncbi:MAG: zinc dependent phospholipase C family protein [Firmicutes bacterium]|nr:zinc dependent phospholipase C family protein [Bacillota bacterium]
MGPLSWNAAKFVLAAGTPIHLIVAGKGDTHAFINRQAVQILQRDGFRHQAAILKKNLEIINKGVMSADQGWKCFAHYCHPHEKNGLKPWPDAATECHYLFERALSKWRKGNKTKAFFLLGAAVHLVHDLCVPHHARGIAFGGHQVYEKWVRERCNEFAVAEGGIYNVHEDPSQWVLHNSKIAWEYFPYVSLANVMTSYRMATGVLLPLAQRTTAGFFEFFLKTANGTQLY